VRPDQTDPGINTTTATDGLGREVSARADGVSRDTPTRPDRSSREVPMRTDANDPGTLPRRERAGSPSPASLEDAPSWQDIKSRFVDDPAGAIAAAEELVRLAVERRVRELHDEVSALCTRGRDEESSSTEGLRTRLIRYQEFCEQLAGSALH